MSIEQKIKALEERNVRVELDKAWETSFLRRGLLTVLTYLVVVVFFYSAGLARPWINSIVPALGFFLSTLTLGVVKKWWIARR